MVLNVSFPIYVIALMSFVSWFLLAFFGGIGLSALPLDFIYAYVTRPKKISRDEIVSTKNKIADAAKNLKEVALEMKQMEENDVLKKSVLSKEKRDYNDKMKKLRAMVHVIDTVFKLIFIFFRNIQ
jgi:LMBR1 domain-containing protein 1